MLQSTHLKSAFLLSVLLASGIRMAVAQDPSTLMQIDGDAASTAGYPLCIYGPTSIQGPCDTWNLLNGTGTPVNAGGTGAGSSAGHSLIRVFIDGTANTDSYTGGGSKDPNDLSQWRWSGNPTPNKDTINDGYAAAYVAPNTSFELMFGANRASASGDANIGVWFFQNPVGLNPNGTFSGLHKNGDIFVISAFTGGGSDPGIQVLFWDSTCASGTSHPTAGQCADSNLRLIAVQPSATSCSSSPYCAATNTGTTAASWVPGGLSAQLFFQGGINLTAALGGGSLPCFSGFLEETRSSASTSAQLKDFVLGGFPVCSLSISKACGTGMNGAPAPSLVNNGTEVLYSWVGSVTNTGVGTLGSVQVNDTLPGSNTVSHPTLTATTLAAGASATFTAQATVAALTATNTATAQGSFGTAVISSTGAPASATCSISPSTSVSVVKSCVAPGPSLACSGSGCLVQVPVMAHVCNLGPIRVTNVTLSDNPTANFPSIAILDPAGTVDANNAPLDCADVTSSYQPTAFDPTSDGATNGRYTFTDTISITSATPALGPPIGAAMGCTNGALACSSVSCPLCSGGECTANPLQ